MLSIYQQYLEQLLPLRQLVVTCRFLQNTTMPFFHQTVFPAYAYTLLDRMPSEVAKTSCRFILPESGKTDYRQGDLYQFGILLFNQTDPQLVQNLIDKINIGIASQDNRILHNNLQVVELIDGFSNQIIHNCHNLYQWQYEDLKNQRQQILKAQSVRMEVTTGILFNQSLHSKKDLTTKRLLQQNLLAVLYASKLPQPAQTQQATQLAKWLDNHPLPEIILDNDLFFVPKTYANKNGRYKHLSGYHGTIDIALPQDKNLCNLLVDLLLINQYIGIGKRTNYGIGQYTLYADQKPQKKRLKRGQSLLDFIFDLEKLTQNHDYAKLNDHQKQEALDIRAQIIHRQYQASPLQSFTQKEIRLNGKIKNRTLAFAPLPERCLQKHAARILSQILDNSQHPASFGYRPERSRQQAVAQIQRQIKYGNNHILESDIADCFDSISLKTIHNRLSCLLADEDLVQWMIDCLYSPIGKVDNIRHIGIPQGCPLSPLIANIVLSDLDNDLTAQGFAHVRFADDFIVCTASQQQTQAALVCASQSLAEHGLSLNPAKTHITQAAENFIFLGYQIDEQSATELCRHGQPENPLEPNTIQQSGVPPISHRGQTLYVCHQKHAQLSLLNNHLLISAGEKIERTPLGHIQQIILLGAHHITTPLVHYCLRCGIDIHYLAHTGKYLGTLCSQNANQYQAQLWLCQAQQAQNPHHCLQLAKIIIGARLHNMYKTLINYQQSDIDFLQRKVRQVETAQDLSQLRGFEGLATRYYYLKINQLLTNTDFEFTNRNRRPPKDPFNVLLSLGYTILYNYLHSFLLSLKLNPDCGFYHRSQSNSIALCSDLIEPFRHFIERAALTVVCRRQIQRHHFYYHNQRCCLTAEGRKIYLSHLAKMLESSSKHGNIFKERNIEKIYSQALSYKHHLQNVEYYDFIAYKE